MQRELSAAEYDLWAELPSPLKSGVRKAFSQYGAGCFREKGILLTGYIPAAMGGSMTREDYLAGFSEKAFPDSCMIMNFGEYSDRTFFEKAAKIYEEQRICAYFPEILVVDKRRLNNRLIPKSYEELTDPVYEKELCILGMPSPSRSGSCLVSAAKYGRRRRRSSCKKCGLFYAAVQNHPPHWKKIQCVWKHFCHAGPLCPDLSGKSTGRSHRSTKRSSGGAYASPSEKTGKVQKRGS